MKCVCVSRRKDCQKLENNSQYNLKIQYNGRVIVLNVKKQETGINQENAIRLRKDFLQFQFIADSHVN